MKRRQFLQLLASLGLSPHAVHSTPLDSDFYQLSPFGQVRLLHFTDCHAQLLPLYYREPLTDLITLGLRPQSREAYAFTALDFSSLAPLYGKMGGFAHLATLIKQLREQAGYDNSLLLDGGDTWQGSATALWTSGQDMVAACNLLGVDVMTGHWEFTYGQKHVLKNCADFQGDFVAQNIQLSEEALFTTTDDSAAPFKPYVIKQLKNARIAIIGQAFPFTPIANPRYFIPDWQFGIQEQNLQTIIEDIQRHKQAEVIVLLSHNGQELDLKLATRVHGLDIILGGHTHDTLPKPLLVNKTWVTQAGSHGKFLAVLDLDIQHGKLKTLRYQLLPVFSSLLKADPAMQNLITTTRTPFLEKLRQPLFTAEELLYRRDTFQGSFDKVLLETLRIQNDAEIAFSAGFRWGNTVLKHETVYFEDLLNHTAITYPNTYTAILSGEIIKNTLEDIADNLFNPDPYYQQGGDMVRVGGMTFRCHSHEKIGRRISECRLSNGELLQAHKHYKIAGWAAVNQQAIGKPLWEQVIQHLQN
jgi:S-sulfosulfanyl-L-cysteine sulfohydrolase